MSLSRLYASFKLALFIGTRYSKTSTKQSFVAFINMFSVMGITLGIAALITVLSVMNGLEGQLKERILGILPHVVLTSDSQLVLDNLSNSDDVVHISSYIEQEAIIQSPSGLKGVFAQGIDTAAIDSYSIIANNMIGGEFSSLSANSFNVVISRSLAAELNVRIGQPLRIISSVASTYSPFGRMPSQRLLTVSGVFEVGSQFDDKVVLMHVSDLAKLSRKKLDSFNSYRVELKDAFNDASINLLLDSNDVSYITWRERQGPLFEAVQMEKNMMSFMLLLIIAVAAFNVISALVMVVNEKTADIAILLTQGMEPRNIKQIFVLNGIFNGLKGIVFGLILGLLLVTQINPFLSLIGSQLAFGPDGKGLPIDLQFSQVFYISLGSLLLCVLATLYPAAKAAEIQPARSLQAQ